MKILLLSALVSMAATAADYTKEELVEIDSSYKYSVEGSVNLEGVNVSVLNACVDGDSIKSISPVAVCTSYGWVDNGENGGQTESRDKVCLNVEALELSAPIEQEVTKCVKFKAGFGGVAERISELPESCKQWGTKTSKLATTYRPNIRVMQGNQDTIVGTKKFALPACN